MCLVTEISTPNPEKGDTNIQKSTNFWILKHRLPFHNVDPLTYVLTHSLHVTIPPAPLIQYIQNKCTNLQTAQIFSLRIAPSTHRYQSQQLQCFYSTTSDPVLSTSQMSLRSIPYSLPPLVLLKARPHHLSCGLTNSLLTGLPAFLCVPASCTPAPNFA